MPSEHSEYTSKFCVGVENALQFGNLGIKEKKYYLGLQPEWISSKYRDSHLATALRSLLAYSLPGLLRAHPDLFDPDSVQSHISDEGDARPITFESGALKPGSSGNPRNLSLKKNHEVATMGASLLRLRDTTGFDTLVDIGCGLGYLEEELRLRLVGSHVQVEPESLLSELNMVGIEGRESFLRSSHVRRQKLFPDSNRWASHSLVATISSAQELTAAIESVTSRHLADGGGLPATARTSNRYFLCGLHACGGLTSSAIRSFVELNRIASRIGVAMSPCLGIYLVGCCYHRMMER